MPSNTLPQSIDYIRVCTPAASSSNELVVQAAAPSAQQALQTVAVVLENLPSWEMRELLDQSCESPVLTSFPCII